MADCDVSVRGEDHEEEAAGDLVDGGGGEVDLAHGGAKGPLPHEHGDNQEGDPNKEALVCHCKVQDVSVRHLRKNYFLKIYLGCKDIPYAFLRIGAQHRSQESFQASLTCRPGHRTPETD